MLCNSGQPRQPRESEKKGKPMNPLEQDELFENLQGFLKTKGIELKDGSYVQTVRKSCGLLSDAINVGQSGLNKARAKIDRKLDQLRQVIHEKTAPPSTPPRPSKSASREDSPEKKRREGRSAARKSKS